MTINFTHVYTKKKEYSEFEPNNRTIDIVVFFDRSLIALNDSFTVEAIKAKGDRDVVVLSSSYIFTSVPPVDYVTVSLDMRNAVDSDGIRLMTRGMYFIRATDVSNPLNLMESPEFKVSIITADYIRSMWLYGVSILASDVMMPNHQPRKVLGVTITGVSGKHPAIPCVLNLQVQDGKKYLSWARGQLIEVEVTHPAYPLKDYFLPGEIGLAGININVDPFSLPDTDAQETIVIDSAKFDNDKISDLIDQAADLIENSMLQIFLEPTICVSEIDPSKYAGDDLPINDDYDRITPAISYFGVSPNHWINIQFPFQHLQRIDYLAGAIAQNKVVQVRTEWAEKDYLSGFVQLVPLHLEMVFAYFGLAWVPSLWGIRDLPNFWHYRAVAGLRTIPGDIMELLGRQAAISILSIAGQAYRGGFAGQSISRDGISESVSFTASAMYGIYSAYIQDHTNWINQNLPTLRNKYRGIVMRVL